MYKPLRKISSIIVILTLLFNLLPLCCFAYTPNDSAVDPDLSETAEPVVAMQQYAPLDENTVPEIIGFEEARSKGHVGRMYEDEGDDLDKLVFINADGSKTMYYFGFPVKYVDANGSIQDISLEIADSDVQIGGFRSTATAASTTFSTQFTDGISLTGDGADIRLVPVLPSSSTGMFAKAVNTSISSQHEAQRVDQNTISYYYDTDTTVEYSLTYTGFKEDIVVSEYTGQTTYPFRLYTNGLGLSKIDGSYHLVDDEGQIRATIGDIIIFTADERNNGVGDIVSTVIEENEEYLLTIVVDADYLADPDTTYPIRIDPTVEINYSGSGAGAIEDITISENTAYSGSHTSLYVGRRATDGVARALMRFPGLDLSGLEGATVTSATVSLRDLMCESDYLTVCCYAFAGAVWNASNATWDDVDPDEFSPQLSRQTMSYSNGIEQPSVHWYDFDITSAVQGWIDGNYTQDKGLLFKATSAVESSSEINNRSLGSYNRSSYKPSLTVTYTPLYGTQLFANDTYYINNKHTGKYAKHTSSTLATTDSGLLSELGTGIQWKLQKVSAGYVIRRASAPDTYLGVPEDTTSNMIEMITIADAPLPESCVWTITVVSGGFRVQNNYNDRYLYHYSTVRPYTAITLGDTGTGLYDSRIWRIVSKTNYSNTPSTKFRELSASSKIQSLEVEVSESKAINITKYFSNEIWCSATDFTYTIASAEKVSISGGNVTGTKRGVVTVTATHKVTNRVKKFEVFVRNSLISNANHDSIQDSFEAELGNGYATAIVYNTYTVSEAVDIVLENDASITQYCNTYQIPKEFVQSVLFREIWCYSKADSAADDIVERFYELKEDGIDTPLELKDDSSTGLGQIFARTAIKALNNADDRGFISLSKQYDETDWRDIWEVWNALRTDNDYNINCCALVILDCQYEFQEITPYEDFFDFSETQIKKILSRYNGTNDAATEYGDYCYEYYLIFEDYNG